VYVTHDQVEAMTLGDWVCMEEETYTGLAGGKSLWTARVSSRSAVRPAVRPGQPLQLAVDTTRLHFFDPDTGASIGHPQTATAAVPSGIA
jgi:multiple sugar transport system ATP-binding protein